MADALAREPAALDVRLVVLDGVWAAVGADGDGPVVGQEPLAPDPQVDPGVGAFGEAVGGRLEARGVEGQDRL